MSSAKVPRFSSQSRRNPPAQSDIDVQLPQYFPLSPTSSRTIAEATDYISEDSSAVAITTNIDPPPSVSEHVEYLQNSRGRWATLRIGHSNLSSTTYPTFSPGDKIYGSVELDLPESKAFKEISLTFRGYYCSVDHHGGTITEFRRRGENFISLSVVLWNAMTGTNGQSRQAASIFARSKLVGQHRFGFTIDVPLRIAGDRSHTASELTPPSFDGGTRPCFVAYEVFAKFKLGFLHPTEILHTPIQVVLVREPGPVSRLRRQAYDSGRLPPGPEVDPSGWIQARPSNFMVNLFRALNLEVECWISVAQPSVYCRRGIIPMQLAIRCRHGTVLEQEQALNLIANPSAINICLARKITVNGSNDSASSLSEHHRNLESSESSYVDPVAMGICWLDRSTSHASDIRVLQCEIRLAGSLAPSFEFRQLRLQYHVLLLPFLTSGLTTSVRKPLCSIPVTVINGHFFDKSYAPAGITEPPLSRVHGAEDEDPLSGLLGSERGWIPIIQGK